MKTTLFTISLVVGVVCLSYENTGATPKRRFSHGTVFTYSHHGVETHAPVIKLSPQVTGVIPRISQGDDPLQRLNSFAPAKYETAEENTALDSGIPGQGDGITFLSVLF